MMIAALLLPVSAQAQCGNAEFAQCGGQGYAGDTCCPEYDECKFVNTFFSQCQPRGLCLVPQYGQCGGSDNHQPPRPWTPENHHQQCCPPSFFCSYQNPHFSQCVYNTTANTTCASAYDQCGGHGWAGKTCCIPGYECVAQTEYYSGCNPAPLCTNTRFGQCGGVDADNNPWTREFGHSDCCPDGFECAYKSTYFSQCMQSSSRAAAAVAIDAPAKATAPPPPPPPVYPYPQDCSSVSGTSPPSWFHSCNGTIGGCFELTLPVEGEYNVGNTSRTSCDSSGYCSTDYGHDTRWCIDHLNGKLYAKNLVTTSVMFFEIDDISPHSNKTNAASCRFLVGADSDMRAYDSRVYTHDRLLCSASVTRHDKTNNITYFDVGAGAPPAK